MARMITTSVSAHRMVHEFGAFLEQQLKGHEKTAEKVGLEFLQVQAALATNLEDQFSTQKELGMVEGKLKWHGVGFYEDIKNFHYQLLFRVESNREDLRYQKYFPGGLTQIGRMNTADQMAEVARILGELEDDEVVGDLTSILQPGYDEMAQVWKEKDDLETRLARLKGDEKSLKGEWELAYKNTRDELKIAFNQNHRKVDAFFRDVKIKSRKVDEIEPVTASGMTSEGPEEGGGDG